MTADRGVRWQLKQELTDDKGSPKGGRSRHRSPIFQRGSGITKPRLSVRKAQRRAARRRARASR